MFSLIDILNISAAWIGAITGVTGLFYSIFINRARLLITDAYAMEVSNEAPYKYSFDIVNPSNSTYTIKSIQLFDDDGKEIKDNHFEPYDSLPFQILQKFILRKDDLHSYPFEVDEIIFPHSSITYSYYLDSLPCKIKVKTSKRIRFIFKHKSIHPVFNKAK